MIEVLFFDTQEESNNHLQIYRNHNKQTDEQFKKIQKSETTIEEILNNQKYYFAAELTANDRTEFFFNSSLFPFYGYGYHQIYFDLPELVEEIKQLIKSKAVCTIEPIFYTIKDHNESNERYRIFVDECCNSLLNALEKQMRTTMPTSMRHFHSFKGQNLAQRCLTEAEIQEFRELYQNST